MTDKQQSTTGQLWQITVEEIVAENLVLRDRVADLEATHELFLLTLARLHAATVREQQLTRRIRALTAAATRLRDAA